ncbi:hypothetical protein MTO96_049169 [Rhipicephalus appendiculatus]
MHNHAEASGRCSLAACRGGGGGDSWSSVVGGNEGQHRRFLARMRTGDMRQAPLAAIHFSAQQPPAGLGHASAPSSSLCLSRPISQRKLAVKQMRRRILLSQQDISLSPPTKKGDTVYLKYLIVHSAFEIKTKAMKQLQIMYEMRHENINSFLGCLADPSQPALVWEMCTRGSLTDVLASEDIRLGLDIPPVATKRPC